MRYKHKILMQIKKFTESDPQSFFARCALCIKVFLYNHQKMNISTNKLFLRKITVNQILLAIFVPDKFVCDD